MMGLEQSLTTHILVLRQKNQAHRDAVSSERAYSLGSAERVDMPKAVD